MGSPVAAYSLLGKLQGMNRLNTASSEYTLSKDMIEEAKEEEKKRRKREKKRGLGRMLGSGGGLLASYLLAPLTGGMSIPLQMLMAGGISGVTSQLGQRTLGGAKSVGIGKFNMQEDRDTEQSAKDSILSSSIKDALTAAMFQGAGGLKKYLPSKGGDAYTNMSSFKNKLYGNTADIAGMQQAASRSGGFGNPYSDLIGKNLNPGVIPRTDSMPFMGLQKPLWKPPIPRTKVDKNTFGMFDYLNQFMREGEYE